MGLGRGKGEDREGYLLVGGGFNKDSEPPPLNPSLLPLSSSLPSRARKRWMEVGYKEPFPPPQLHNTSSSSIFWILLPCVCVEVGLGGVEWG